MGRTRESAGTSQGQSTTSVDPNRRPITKKWVSLILCLAAPSSVVIHPTRCGYPNALRHLGLLEDAETLFQTIGLEKPWALEHFTYPKLLKEFLATCRLRYNGPQDPVASEGTLTFFLNKKHFSMSLFEFCEVNEAID
ncbi:uncharacterized protein LOC111829560 [Capsella rubella]|uniref:uncharacterized protein LOC111829560 n=1 Tax=Capsella rubella TaxID=81985 RepID=UPI000CD49E5E|nr:uncharacterized protein LOC111829560 [Capsella rubella]